MIMSPFKLLVDEPVFDVTYMLDEQNRNAPSTMYLSGPFLMAEEVNKNKRRYPLEEMVKEVDRYNIEMIVTKRSTGELNHPQSPEINLERVCHMVTNLKQNGNYFEGKSKMLSTPLGILAKSLVLDGVKLGVSSRSLGRLVEESNSVKRVEGLRIVAIDVVADPSVPTAFVNGILESKQWVLNEAGQFEPLYAAFEKDMATLPKKDTEKYLKEHILAFINALKNS